MNDFTWLTALLNNSGDLTPAMCPENNISKRPNRNSSDRLEANGPPNHMVVIWLNVLTETRLVKETNVAINRLITLWKCESSFTFHSLLSVVMQTQIFGSDIPLQNRWLQDNAWITRCFETLLATQSLEKLQKKHRPGWDCIRYSDTVLNKSSCHTETVTEANRGKIKGLHSTWWYNKLTFCYSHGNYFHTVIALDFVAQKTNTDLIFLWKLTCWSLFVHAT